MPDYIFDTTVLSNFAAAGKSELLAKRYGRRAFTTVEVVDEMIRGVKKGYSYLESIVQKIEIEGSNCWLRILVPSSADEHLLRSQFDPFLDQGEASCLALATSREMIFATDDLAARRLSLERKISITGTLGVLIEMVQNEILSLKEANEVLSVMIRENYRSPEERLDEFL